MIQLVTSTRAGFLCRKSPMDQTPVWVYSWCELWTPLSSGTAGLQSSHWWTFQFTLCFQSLALSPCRSPAIATCILCIAILTSYVKSSCYSYKWTFMKSLSQRGYVFTQLSEAYRMVGSLAQLGTGGKNYKELKKN